MKYLDGRELAGYVKERQAAEARRLHGAGVSPKLVVISQGKNEVNDVYLRLKQKYGRDIGVTTELIQSLDVTASQAAILQANEDDSVHGIVVQLPLSEPARTDEVVNLIEPAKDVDGLGRAAGYQSATATAIVWLLAGYNIELRGKSIVIVGRGRLVGQPLQKMLQSMELEPQMVDEQTESKPDTVKRAEVLVTAAGRPGLITSDWLKPGAVVVDAGTASEGGQVKGDVADEVYERSDITITPQKGGAGPLTVSALFDNVLRAARAKVAS